MLDYSNITTILCRPLYYNHLQYEYAINSTDYSQYASREEMFTIIHDVMPANRIKLIDLLETSVPFVAIIPEYKLLGLSIAPINQADIEKLFKEVRDNSTRDVIKTKNEENSNDSLLKKAINKLSNIKLFDDKGDFIG